MEPIYADPEKSRLRGPFRIYENFRNVYKGVRKNAGNKGSYAFDGGGTARAHHAAGAAPTAAADVADSGGGGGGGGGCGSLEAAAAATSSAESPSKRTSNDGNSSGSDSGIDSFSDNNASPEPNAEDGSLKRRNVWKRDLVINDASPGGRKATAAAGKSGDVQLKAVKSKVKETVLAIEKKYSDVDPVYSKVNKVSAVKAAAPSSKELKELSKMLNDTGDLLSRNSNLRASLTITMKKRTKGGGATKTTTTILLPTPKLDRKKNQVVEIEEPIDGDDGAAAAAAPAGEARKEEAVTAEKEKAETAPPPPPAPPDPQRSPFVRHNPSRKPTARRSMRLAPKTVLALANKFDSLLPNDAPNSAVACAGSTDATKPPSAAKAANTKDISSIISALNKLDEEASKDTAVLRRSLRRAALQKARVERKVARGEEVESLEESAAPECLEAFFIGPLLF